MSVDIADIVRFLDGCYPPERAAAWDAVGPVCGHAAAPVKRVLFSVDCVSATVDEAVASGSQLIVTHHPLLLRGVTSLDPSGYKGAIVHRLIESGIGLYVAHTNADVASPGVSDALARRLGLVDLRPLEPIGDGPEGSGRIGRLPTPMSLRAFVDHSALLLPPTAWGVRAAGDPDRTVATVAVCGGAGDTYLGLAAAAGVDAYLTADLRHHPASEHAEAHGPALVDAAHWATERPWLDAVASRVRREIGVDTVVSDHNTDPWTLRASSPG